LDWARRTFGQSAIVLLRLFNFLAGESDNAKTDIEMTMPFADVAERLFNCSA